MIRTRPRTLGLLGALLALPIGTSACADEARRQALVTLVLEPQVQEQLGRLSIVALTPAGLPYATASEIDLRRLPAPDRAVPSFGALPWDDGKVRLRIEGFARVDGAQLIEQLFVGETREQGITALRVALRDACLGQLPCPVACLEDGAADLPPCEGLACELGTPFDCAACGDRCSERNANEARCTDGACEPVCQDGYADCNAGRVNDGCETDLRSDADHCGSCGRGCAYGVCVEGLCPVDCTQTLAPPAPEDTSSVVVPANAFVGQRIDIRQGGGGVLSGLGIYLGTQLLDDTPVRFRMALYDAMEVAGQSVPRQIIDQTGQLRAGPGQPGALQGIDGCGLGALEQRVSSADHVVQPGTYWLLLIPSAALVVRSDPARLGERVKSRPSPTYTEFDALPNTPYLADLANTIDADPKSPALYVFPIFTPPR